MSRRVVITGLDCITPLGHSLKESWSNLLSSQQRLTSITDLPNYETEYKPFEKYLPAGLKIGKVHPLTQEQIDNSPNIFTSQDERRITLLIKQTILTAYNALSSAQLLETKDSCKLTVDPERVSTSIGTGLPPVQEIYDSAVNFHSFGRRPSPMFIPRILPNMIAGTVSIKFNTMGPSQTVSTACATGNNAIIDGYNNIRNNMADVAIVGATEASLHPLTIAGFHRLKSLSTSSVSRPFDKGRDGFVISEGTGVMILEELEHAMERIANDSTGRTNILGELIGTGLSSDAYHITSPNGNGIGAQKSMEMALKMAKIKPNAVNLINAHATSTPIGDLAEYTAINNVFNNEIDKNSTTLYVTSNKGAMGHLLGASGVVESIFTLLSLENNTIPHTLNLKDDSTFSTIKGNRNIEIVKNTPLANKYMKYAMTNSFGFGGVNTSLLFKKWDQ